MNLRDIIASVHIPYRKVGYGLTWVGMVALFAPDWLPMQYFFLRYVAIALDLAVMLYFAFWVYRGGYRKQGLLYALVSVALAAIVIVLFVHLHSRLAALTGV